MNDKPTPELCERCGYDEAEPTATVPEYYQDRYQALCSDCEKDLLKRQAKSADWSCY